MFSSLIQSWRLARAGFVMARHGALDLVTPEDLPGPARIGFKIIRALAGPKTDVAGKQSSAKRLTAALTELGPSYIKFGQFLATRSDIIGAERANDLAQLQDNIPAFAQSEAETAVEAALHAPVKEIFSSFSKPIAAASIAQVHKATLETEDGEQIVAVKILRPGIEKRFTRDMDSFFFMARAVERFHPASRRLKPVAAVETLAQSVNFEMDLRLEAAAISEMAENIVDDPGFRVPEIYWPQCAKRVLTIEWIDGIPLTDRDALEASDHDLKALGANVIQSFLRHAMRDGFFHADMHPGNLFVDEDGDIVAVDFGIMGRLGIKERRFLAEILWGFIQRDYTRISDVHFEAGYVAPHQDRAAFAQSLRAIGEPLMGKTAEDISMANLLTQLFQNTELFEMEARPELMLLQKTMMVVEGVGRMLDPELNMWDTSKPVVKEWMESNLGPEGRLHDAAEGAANLGRFMGQLPGLLGRAETISLQMADMATGGLRLDHETVQKIASEQRHQDRWSRRALWVGALALAAIAWHFVG